MEQTERAPARQDLFDFNTWLYITVAVPYVVAVFLLYPLYQYRINPDQTALFSIAMKYARGDWFNAISSHWPPLLTWLLALGLKAGLKIVPCATIVDTTAGLLMLWSCNRLATRLGASRIGRTSVLVLVAVYALYFIFDETRTDTLLTSILTYYLAILSDDASLRSVKTACIAGAVAGLAYYARSYALFFVPVHLAVMTVLEGLGAPRYWLPAWRRAGIIMVAMLAVSAPWIICLSWKYGHFTFSSAGDFMLRAYAPKLRYSGVVNLGLAAPPNPTASNYWEDPTRLNLAPWSPFQSRVDFQSYVELLVSNVPRLIAWSIRLSLVAAAIFLIVLIRWMRGARDRTTAVLLTAEILYTAGICLFFVADRYLWPVAIWIMVMAFSLPRNSILCTVLALSFALNPILVLRRTRHQGEKEYAIGQTLDAHLAVRGNVASLSRWLDSLYICYYAGLPYYGIPVTGSAENIQQQLAQYDIKYLFVWDNQPVPPHLLDSMRRISGAGGQPPDVQVYTRANIDVVSDKPTLNRE